MRITKKIAELIVKKTTELTQLNMNVMDRTGLIISSSDPERIGTLHEGAAEVVRTGEEIVITEERLERWAGTKPGINMPIYFHHEVVGVIGISGKESDVVPFGRAVKMMTELLLQQSYLTEQVELKERSKTFLAQELISASPADQAERDSLYARGELLGIDLKLPRAILLIRLDAPPEAVEYRFRFKEAEAMFPNQRETLIAQLGRGRWLILADASVYKNNRHAKKALLETASGIHALLAARFEAPVHIVVGTPCADIGSIADSFAEAERVLNIARKEAGQDGVIHIEDSSLELMLSEVSDGAARRLVDQVLGELVGHPVLVDTLQAFYDHHMNLAATANALSVHRNTLIYRIERIESFVGADPRHFRQALRLQLALMLHRIQETQE